MKLHEIKGSEVMDFADFIQGSQWIPKKHREAFEKLGNALFKKGFKLHTNNNLRFSKEDGADPHGWTIGFPYARRFNDGVEMMYTGYDDEHSQLLVGRAYFTLDEIETFGLDTCLENVKKLAAWKPT